MKMVLFPFDLILCTLDQPHTTLSRRPTKRRLKIYPDNTAQWHTLAVIRHTNTLLRVGSRVGWEKMLLAYIRPKRRQKFPSSVWICHPSRHTYTRKEFFSTHRIPFLFSRNNFSLTYFALDCKFYSNCVILLWLCRNCFVMYEKIFIQGNPKTMNILSSLRYSFFTVKDT